MYVPMGVLVAPSIATTTSNIDYDYDPLYPVLPTSPLRSGCASPPRRPQLQTGAHTTWPAAIPAPVQLNSTRGKADSSSWRAVARGNDRFDIPIGRGGIVGSAIWRRGCDCKHNSAVSDCRRLVRWFQWRVIFEPRAGTLSELRGAAHRLEMRRPANAPEPQTRAARAGSS
jgi:hypothetical protein